jgi:hypothetical protein
MNIRNIAASLTLAAGSFLFVAQPALHAQSYYSDAYYSPRYSTHRAIEHDKRELNSALRRGNYAAAHREIREIEQRRARLARARWARTHRYRRYNAYYGYR